MTNKGEPLSIKINAAILLGSVQALAHAYKT